MNNTRTPLFLMANLGSEMIRVFNAKDKKDLELLKSAIERAEKILEKIEEFPEMRARSFEMEKIRYILEDFRKGDSLLSISKDNLESFFNPLALRLAVSN